MTLVEPFNLTMEAAPKQIEKLPCKELMALIDLTLLDEHATKDDILTVAKKAAIHQVAALCILPSHLPILSKPYPIKRATVVNFPSGMEPVSQVLSSIQSLATRGEADEIDYVFPYPLALSGQLEEALSHCRNAYQCSKKYRMTFKVILETGAFDSMDQIYELSLSIIQQGCDFLKTSTGKHQVGATPAAVFAMLAAIKDSQLPCGIKVSGGIRTIHDAQQYLQLAKYVLKKHPENTWFRIGASSLLDEILIAQNQSNPHQCSIPNTP